MTAILKRELKEYFYTPIGYVFVGFFMFLTSWIFSYTNIFSASGDLSSLFGNLTIVFMFLITLVLSLVYPIIVSVYSKPPVSELLAVYIGFFLMGISYISIGVFISSLTENQIISAVATFAILFVLNLIDMLSAVITNPILTKIISYLSITNRYADFTDGIVRIDSVIYYLSVSALFVFLTCNQLEKRRFRK